MKKQAYTTIAMIVLFGCLAVSAKAQCAGPAIAKIPFPFNAGKTALPAGEYKVTCFPNSGRLLIRSTDGKANAVMSMINISGRSQESGTLVFHRYGSRYFFVQAWTGADIGLELPMTPAERAVARELAGLKPQREEIALAVRH